MKISRQLLRGVTTALLFCGVLAARPVAAGRPSLSAQPGAAAQVSAVLVPTADCDPSRQSCAPGPTPGPSPTPSPLPPACGPSPSGSPCGGSGPASLGSSSGTNQGAGNPINVINGNKYQHEVDMPALPGVLGLELARHYNSAWRGLGQTGYGWRLSYETDLFVVRNTVQIRQADGTELIFNRDPKNPSVCSSANPANGRVLIKTTPRGDEFVWLWTNGRKLAFDQRGKLESITAPSGEFVTLQHGPKSELLKVTDPQGRSLSLEYASPNASGFKGIVAIQSPLGRFVLQHNDDRQHPGLANLMAVTAPQGATRRYHYGADAGEANPAFPHHLTGISLDSLDVKGKATTQRLNTWAYDVNGRGILSVKGLPRQTGPDGQTQAGTGIEQVKLDFGMPGKTVLTNSLGQTTTYTHAIVGNTFRLLEVRGAGCASCGEVNLRYGYDKLGRLTEQTTLSPQGLAVRMTRTELDGLGRVVRVSAINYVQAKPQAPRLLARYEYAGDGMQPTLIARPSVINQPGATSGARLEHQTRVVYNQAGQPLSVSESGFSPLDENGQPLNPASAKTATAEAERASPISRSTSYRYSTINGRNVLTQIDGPLKNGAKGTPEDSDITVLAYDQRADYLQSSTAPGNFKTSYQHDAAGRVITQAMNDGFRQIQSDTRYSDRANIANEPQQITRSAWTLKDGKPDPDSRQTLQVLQAKFDAQGRRTESTGTDGLTKTLSYDAANRPITLTNAQGHKMHWAYQPEGELLAQVSQDKDGQVVDGRMWLRDEAGRLRATLNPQGIERIYAYVDDGKPEQDRSANDAGPLKPADRGQTSPERRRLRDDFGRVVYERHPEDGVILTRFQAAPGADLQTQVRTSTDGKLHSNETLRFDAAGRLQSRTRGEPGKDRCSETLRYQGQLLIVLEGCGSSQQFERDAFGHITAHRQTLEQGKAQYAQRYRYDQSGQLVSRSTADGQVLRYGYDAKTNTTQVVSLQRDWLGLLARIAGPANADRLAAWLPQGWGERALIDRVAKDASQGGLARLQGLAHGNGTAQSWVMQPPAAKPQALRVGATTKPGSTATAFASSGPAMMGAAPAHGSTPHAAPSRDGFGRQTRHTPRSGSHVGQQQILVWNDAHQLVAVHSAQSGETLASYRYDASGNRIAKTVSGRTTLYLYDTTHRLIAHGDERGKIDRQYLYTDHRVHSILQGEEVYAVHTDWRGLPSRVTDHKQRVVWAGRFDRWGNKTSDGATVPNVANPQTTNASTENSLTAFEMPLRLAGQQYDDETGLHYNVHRYYDPARGRYISADPLGTPDGSNRYAYLRGNPQAGIDPLGLFEIPVKFFSGDPLNVLYDLENDEGHGDIIRIAMAQYQLENGKRFSDHFIDWIIRNNYHTDANGGGCYPLPFVVGGGQCNAKNHFDNPNDGPMYKNKGTGGFGDRELLPDYRDGKNDHWIQDAVDQLGANRSYYQNVTFAPKGGVDISRILSAFGQNSHALADFYAHSNWVDAATRGGCVKNVALGGLVKEEGYVPIGLAQTRAWDEDFDAVDMKSLFSGTVAGASTFCPTPIKGDIVCTSDKTTHGYWNKDSDNSEGGKEAYRGPLVYGWRVESYDPSAPLGKPGNPDGEYKVEWHGGPGVEKSALAKGARIYVRHKIENKHQLAFYLAIEHTKKEIAKLYEGAASVSMSGFKLQDIFKMGRDEMWANNVVYDGKISKQ